VTIAATPSLRAGARHAAAATTATTSAGGIDNAEALRIRSQFPALDQEVNGKP
jgi:hypothetical protein